VLEESLFVVSVLVPASLFASAAPLASLAPFPSAAFADESPPPFFA
jgi:hypothetical protein